MIAVVSDSHVSARAEEIPEKFMDIVKKADKVVHCGDFVDKGVHDRIKRISNDFYAVKGNCDRFRLPNSRTFSVDETEFGVYHGTGISPRGHHPTLLRIADDLEVKVLFHGHTHQQEAVKKQGKILLNPGSCTGVGGGSSDRGNPEMMTVSVQDHLDADLITLSGSEVKKEKKRFQLE